MGQEVVKAVCREPEMLVVGAVDVQAEGDSLALPDGSGSVPFSTDLEHILNSCQADVLVDFTVAKAAMPAARTALNHGVNLVIGTTGLNAEEIAEIGSLAAENKLGAVVASNFALGAILMMHMAKIAARYFDYAEIIELHHDKKADAPSGTALSTAKAMVAARGKPFLQSAGQAEAQKSRGQQVDAVAVHSVRLPGLLAHQEVLLGGLGQTLNIRHDTISRECFMPGVVLAVKEVVERKGLVQGLDALLDL
jgi:4-hydroxy-tetrahydrodipicolinate reductase